MRGAEVPGRGLDQGDLIHAMLRNFSPSHRLGGRLLCVWGGVLPGSLVGRARGFLLPPFAGACIVSEEGSSCGVVVVVVMRPAVDVLPHLA